MGGTDLMLPGERLTWPAEARERPTAKIAVRGEARRPFAAPWAGKRDDAMIRRDRQHGGEAGHIDDDCDLTVHGLWQAAHPRGVMRVATLLVDDPGR